MSTTDQSIINPAGFWIRLGAILLDSLIIFLPLGLIVYFLLGKAESDIFTNILNVLYYLILPIVWYGYTVGKRIVGIRIAKVNGEKLGFGTMFLRVIVGNLIYILIIPFIISVFMVGLRKDKRSLHDLIAGTYVTYEKPNLS